MLDFREQLEAVAIGLCGSVVVGVYSGGDVRMALAAAVAARAAPCGDYLGQHLQACFVASGLSVRCVGGSVAACARRLLNDGSIGTLERASAIKRLSASIQGAAR